MSARDDGAVRPATPGDASAIAHVQARAWARAYGDFMPPEAYDEEAAVRRTGEWRERLDGGATVLVYDLTSQIAGFASIGPVRDEEEPGVGELSSIYVDPPAQGAGVGRALLDAADAALRAAGFREAVLWVFTENAFARDVYERRGWVLEPAGVIERLHGADWWAPAVRYRRTL